MHQDSIEQTRCTWALLSEGRICDKPAIGVYVGLGGSQPVCDEHAGWLRQRWGIKIRPLLRDAARSL